MADNNVIALGELTAKEAVVELKMHKANGIKVGEFNSSTKVADLRKLVGKARKAAEKAEESEKDLGGDESSDEDTADSESTDDSEEESEDESSDESEDEEEEEEQEEAPAGNKDVIVVEIPDGSQRSYSAKTHGPKYKQLALAYKKNRKGKFL